METQASRVGLRRCGVKEARLDLSSPGRICPQPPSLSNSNTWQPKVAVHSRTLSNLPKHHLSLDTDRLSGLNLVLNPVSTLGNDNELLVPSITPPVSSL